MQPATSSWWSTGKNAPKSSDTEKNPDILRDLQRNVWVCTSVYLHGQSARVVSENGDMRCVLLILLYCIVYVSS